MKYLETALTSVATVCLVLVLLVSSMQILCFTGTGWYEHEYAKYGVLEHVRENEYTGKTTSMAEALEVTETLIDYSTGKIPKLSGFYSEREKLHLKDCRVLFLFAFRARNVLALVIVAIAMALGMRLRKLDAGSKARAWRRIFRIYVITVLVIAGILLALYLAPGGSFDEAFAKFHGVFFSNDLWLLDPWYDNLINLLVIGFFVDTVKVIVVSTMGGIVIAGGVLRLLCFCSGSRCIQENGVK